MARTKFPVEILSPEGEVCHDEVEMVSTRTSRGLHRPAGQPRAAAGDARPGRAAPLRVRERRAALRPGRGLPPGGRQPRAAARRGGPPARRARRRRPAREAQARRAGGCESADEGSEAAAKAARDKRRWETFLAIAEGGELAAVGERTEHAPGTFSWAELATTDTAGAKTFYTSLFGWEAEDQPIPGGGGAYTFLRKDGLEAAALHGHLPDGTPPNWTSYVTVDGRGRRRRQGARAGRHPARRALRRRAGGPDGRDPGPAGGRRSPCGSRRQSIGARRGQRSRGDDHEPAQRRRRRASPRTSTPSSSAGGSSWCSE